MIESRLKKGLGRGLSSLIGDISKKVEKNEISINDLIRNKLQPRKTFNKEKLEELTNSIKEHGLIQPIIVRPDKTSEGKYQIIAGERRWLASQNAGLHKVPIVILDVDDERSLEFAIVENVQRQDLNAIEEAQGYKRLIDDFGYNQDKLSKFIGKSRSYIANSLRLLSLPDSVIDLVEKGSITAGHARTLVGFTNPKDIAKIIIAKNLSVRQTEHLIKHFKIRRQFKLISSKETNIIDLEKSLEEAIGLKIIIKNKKNNSGQILFEYKNLEQLEKIISVIKNNY